MQKGFTLAETLITMAVIAIVMTISIPMVIVSTNDTTPLFKKAYKTVETVVNEIIDDSAFYPNGVFTNNTFCNNFFSKLSTIGYNPNNCTNTFIDAIPGTPVATTSNGMRWYDVQNDFDTAQCDGASGGGGTTGIDTDTNTCIKLSVDINGANKGANITTDQANKDIFTIYITASGRVVVETANAQIYDEEYILQQ